MGRFEKFYGKEKIHQGMIFATLLLYLAIFAISPVKAEKCVVMSLLEVKKLLIPIIVAILMSGMVKNLMSKFFLRLLGKWARIMGVLTGEALGSVLPPCPLISYPIIKGFKDGGASHIATMAMLVGITSVGMWRMFVGLVIFEPVIVGIRIMFTFLAVGIVNALYFYLTCTHGQDVDKGAIASQKLSKTKVLFFKNESLIIHKYIFTGFVMERSGDYSLKYKSTQSIVFVE